MVSLHKANKKVQKNWYQYELYKTEPKLRKHYDMSPELEDEVLDNGYFLKARVRRNMRKIRRNYSSVSKEIPAKTHLHRPHRFRIA